MPDLRSLEVFYWVARLKSFRRASEKLNTTQPAVSQRIAGLEQELGVRLFDRASRGVSLTGKGLELLSYAERMLLLRTEMMAALAEPAALSGVVRVGVAETIVHMWLSRFVERVHAVYPSVTLDIDVDISPNLRDALVAHEIDLAFLLGPVSDPRMANAELARYPLAFAARPDFPLPPDPVPVSALIATPIITYPRTTRPYLALKDLLTRADLPPPRLYPNASLSTIVRMTLDGIGVSVIPPVVIARELEEGLLRLVRSDVDLPDLVFTATYPVAPDNMLARALAEIARTIAAENHAETASVIRQSYRKGS